MLAGGRSAEHEVSLASGRAVREGLQAAGHEVLWVQIERDGAWRHEGELLSVCPGAGLLGADVVFPALHGPFGEDGTVQGTARDARCGVRRRRGGGLGGVHGQGAVQAADGGGGRGSGRVRGRARAALAHGTRARCSPRSRRWGCRCSSSRRTWARRSGIVKVSAAEELADALEQAFAHDALVIVEAHGRRASRSSAACSACLSVDRDGPATTVERRGRPRAAFASEPGEIVFEGEWYDYAAKYTPGGMELKVPARISASARERVKELALEAFAYAGCEGLARVDFFVDGERVLVNELNTMPGFTPTSVYAKLMERLGDRLPGAGGSSLPAGDRAPRAPARHAA